MTYNANFPSVAQVDVRALSRTEQQKFIVANLSWQQIKWAVKDWHTCGPASVHMDYLLRRAVEAHNLSLGI